MLRFGSGRWIRVVDLPTRAGFLASARLFLGAEPPKAELRSLISSRLGFEIDGILSAAEGEVPDTDDALHRRSVVRGAQPFGRRAGLPSLGIGSARDARATPHPRWI